MKQIIKICTILVAYLLLIVALWALHKGGLWHLSSHPLFWWFALPFVGSFVLFWRFLPTNSFHSTLRHELCHWFFAFVSFNKPAMLNVYAGGSGNYSYYGKSNYFITLSPYFFPLLSVVLLLLSLFFGEPSCFFFLLLGVVFAFETVAMIQDYHPQQSDLHKYGMVFSFLFSVAMYLLCAFWLLIVLFKGWKGYGMFLMQMIDVLIDMFL